MRFVRGKRGMAAAGEDSIIQKLQSAAADGVPAGDGRARNENKLEN